MRLFAHWWTQFVSVLGVIVVIGGIIVVVLKYSDDALSAIENHIDRAQRLRKWLRRNKAEPQETLVNPPPSGDEPVSVEDGMAGISVGLKELAEAAVQPERELRHEELTPKLRLEYRWMTNPRTNEPNLKAIVANQSPRAYSGMVFTKKGASLGPTGQVAFTAFGTDDIWIMREGDPRVDTVIIGLDCDAICDCGRLNETERHYNIEFQVPVDLVMNPPGRT